MSRLNSDGQVRSEDATAIAMPDLKKEHQLILSRHFPALLLPGTYLRMNREEVPVGEHSECCLKDVHRWVFNHLDHSVKAALILSR